MTLSMVEELKKEESHVKNPKDNNDNAKLGCDLFPTLLK